MGNTALQLTPSYALKDMTILFSEMEAKKQSKLHRRLLGDNTDDSMKEEVDVNNS